MRWAAAASLLLCTPLWAADGIEIKSGPFVVLSEAGEKPARAALNQLEQFRYALGQSMGRQDLKSLWPIVVWIQKGKTPPAPVIGFGRNSYVATWPPDAQWMRKLAGIFFSSNLQGRMPSNTEDALGLLFSTLDVKGTKLTLGAPPPANERTADWARLHMLATKPEYSGKVRVLLSNLSQGAEEDPSYRNAFEKSRAVLDQEAAAYLAAGQFETIAVNGKPIDPERQFYAYPATARQMRLLGPDLLTARGAKPAEIAAAYRALLNEDPSPAAQEGYGLAMLAEGDKAAAKTALAAAANGEDAGPRAFVELARMETDAVKAQALLESALKRNPSWGEPWWIFAQREQGPNRRALAIKKAAELDPRNLTYWQALAEAQTDLKNFEEASKAWAAAERVAPAEQREQIVRARLASEQRQIDQQAEEKRRKAQAEREEVEKLRLANLENIRKAEEKTRNPNLAADPKVEKWWDGPPATRLTGVLERVECLGKRARIHVRGADKKVTQLLITDPGKVALIGEGQHTLGCGPQKPARPVAVEYTSKPGAMGEVLLVEFLK